MPSVADCLRQHGPAYLAKFGERVPLGHRQVIGAITRCRTGELGGVVYQCEGCGRQHWVGRSCGNRHCPSCQIDKTAAWLEKQTSRLLPVQHFLVTCTVPEELRRVLRAHPKDGYDAIFQSGSESVTFRYTPSGEKRSKTRTVRGEEFVRGFLQHVLPRGFQKVRYYGWMSPNNKVGFDSVRWLVWLFLGWTYWLGSGHAPQTEPKRCEPLRCAACGCQMDLVGVVLLVNCRALVEHSVAYLDSG